MAIRSDDITQIIKSAIDEFDSGVETRSVGTVVEVGDGIARIYGLEGALASELLEFPNGIKGMALNLEEETVGAVIMGHTEDITEGTEVKRTGRIIEVPVGPGMVGRVVDSLGRPIDGKGPIEAAEHYPLITQASTTTRMEVRPYTRRGPLVYGNTNRLLKNKSWDIELSKTGYINEAGRCLVMQANIEGEDVSIVLLNSFGKLTPFGDSNRLRKWMLANS